MPWQHKGIIFMREELVLKILANEASISELCREYKISRTTAYKWIDRYSKDGKIGLVDRSTRPTRIPNRTDHTKIDLILETRDKYPAWGARKLRQVLINAGHKDLPSESSFNRILQRNDRILPEVSERGQKYIRFQKEFPNQLWQMDFKGHFAIKNGSCHPLTILDDHSRYSICLKACAGEREPLVREGLEEAFYKYGLPDAMTMDNGVPWMGCWISVIQAYCMAYEAWHKNISFKAISSSNARQG